MLLLLSIISLQNVIVERGGSKTLLTRYEGMRRIRLDGEEYLFLSDEGEKSSPFAPPSRAVYLLSACLPLAARLRPFRNRLA